MISLISTFLHIVIKLSGLLASLFISIRIIQKVFLKENVETPALSEKVIAFMLLFIVSTIFYLML